jgi:5'-nucleotidase
MRASIRLLLGAVAFVVAGGSEGPPLRTTAVAVSAQAPYRVLLTNDDGVLAPGLRAMADALRAGGNDVTIIGPRDNQSAKGTSLVINDPIVREDVKLPNGMAAIGLSCTPATSMRIALFNILKERPQLVISGINRGTNLGYGAYISGTVGAAREAAIAGIPAIATSLAYRAATDVDSYRAGADATMRIVNLVKKEGLPKGVFLNVSIPPGTTKTFKGTKVTTQGVAYGGEATYAERTHPLNKRTYYWDTFVEGGKDAAGTDTMEMQAGYVTVTPLRAGEFDRAMYERLQKLLQ